MVEVSESVKENLKNIKSIIGIYSGKGGVDKTTIAVNIAALLASQGYRVCLLDADIDCPNVARSLGIKGELDVDVLDSRIIPSEKYGFKVISMSSLQKEEDEAIIWRGPMLTNTLMHFFGNVNWGTADYLIVDMPPGTSDVPITVMKFLKPDGIVLVTTPRSIAEVDARKSANLAKLTDVKVLGVIENMSGGIFGTGKGKECAETLGIKFFGKIKFSKEFMISIDEGYPAVLKHESAKDQIKKIVDEMQKSEKLIGKTVKKPGKGVKLKVTNLALDFKDELIDRYKSLGK